MENTDLHNMYMHNRKNELLTSILRLNINPEKSNTFEYFRTFPKLTQCEEEAITEVISVR